MSSLLSSRSDRISHRLTVYSYGSANGSANRASGVASDGDRSQSPLQTPTQWRKLFGLTGSSLNLQADGRSTQAVGDDFNSAQDLGNLSGKAQATWRGTFTGSSNRDMFRFSLSQRSRMRLSLDRPGSGTNLRLFRNNGSEVNLSAKPGELRGRLGAGTYFVQVSAASGAPNYTLRVRGSGQSIDPGSSTNRALDAGELTGMNRLYRGEVSRRDRSDLYRFDLTERGTVNLTLRNLKREANLKVYDRNGIVVSDGMSDGMSGDRLRKSVSQALNAGTYFVEVAATDAARTRYALQLSTATRSIDPTPIDPPTATGDPGNSLTQAEVQRSPSFTRQEQVNWGDASDFYRFNVNQSGVFTANLTGLSGDADVRLIQDRNNNGAIDQGEILAWQWERGTTSESIRQFLTAGNYFLQVRSHNGETANYTVSSNFSAGGVDSRKFSIQLNYASGLDKIGNSIRNALNNAASFWESVIPYSSFNGKHTLNIDVVGANPDDNWYAVARSTAGAIDSNGKWMPTQGTIKVNTQYSNLFNQNPEYFSEILIHEFAHVLGIGTLWEKNGRNFIDRNSSSYSANTYAGWAYGEITGKATPAAVPVEPGIFGHWDESKLDDEMLTPEATRVGVKMPLSQVTIASLRDIGWNVNYGGADNFMATRALTPARSTRASATPLSTDLGLPIRCGCPQHLAQSASSLHLVGRTQLSDLIG